MWRFWRCTPADFIVQVKGSQKVSEASWRKVAQHASWTLAAWVEKAPTADRLLGKTKAVPDFQTREELVAHINEKNKDG